MATNQNSHRYSLIPLKGKPKKFFELCDDTLKISIADAIDKILQNPKKCNPPGSIHKMKGFKKAQWEFDLNSGDRIQYNIDDKNNIIQITYIGRHP